TSYVTDQEVTQLCAAVRRIIAANESRPRAERQTFAPLVAKPIIPVDVKIVGILHRMSRKRDTSMQELLHDAVSLNDMIAIFLGILELVKVRKILIDEDPDSYTVIHGVNTRFVVNDAPPVEGEEEKEYNPAVHSDEPIPLSSKAEMHREQRRIVREAKLAEKKRLRAEERARRAEERRRAKEEEMGQTLIEADIIPEDDSDLEAEAKIAQMLDDQLSEDDEDLLDDIGLDMNDIIKSMAQQAKNLPDDSN
ncbi:MAG: hypothetical protein IJV73_08020, partial [Clostridia bacterium]|nr:hypothetical protein [Clostridia bacterium]